MENKLDGFLREAAIQHREEVAWRLTDILLAMSANALNLTQPFDVLLQWLHWHADDTSEGDKPSPFSDAFPCGWASHHCLTKWKPLWPAILFDIMPAAPPSPLKNTSIRIGLSISMIARTAEEGAAEVEGGGEGAAEPSHPSVLDCVDAARAIREEIAKKLTADKKTKELVVDGIPHVPESLEKGVAAIRAAIDTVAADRDVSIVINTGGSGWSGPPGEEEQEESPTYEVEAGKQIEREQLVKTFVSVHEAAKGLGCLIQPTHPHDTETIDALSTDLPDVPLFLAPLAKASPKETGEPTEARQGESGQSGKGGLLWAMRKAAGAVGPAQAIKSISPHITKAVCVMFAPLPSADSSESEEDETPLLTTSLLLTALLTCGVCCLKSGSQPCVYLGGVPAAESDVMQALNEVERHLKAIPWTKAS